MLLRYCFAFDLSELGLLMAVPALVVTLFCPLLGYLSDKLQHRGYLLSFAMLLCASTQFYMYQMEYSHKNYWVLMPLTLN